MKLVSMLRHKNGMKYFPRLIPQLVSISDAIVFLDDNSTDGSFEELQRLSGIHKNFVVLQRKIGEWGGGADWNFLFDYVKKLQPEWLFVPDVDELIEESEAHRVKELVNQSGKDILGWSFPFYYLWNDDKHYRDDGSYNNTKVIRLIRYNLDFPPPDRATHATAVSDASDRRMIRVADIRMWHFGYMEEQARRVKYDFYTSRDKDPEAAGSGGKSYDHLIQTPSNLPEIPTLDIWKSNKSVGDCLKACPKRLSIGGFFPLSHEVKLEDLLDVPAGSVDELRISYLLDSMSVSDIKATLDQVHRVLRPGGRIEVIANDYDGMCKAFYTGEHETKVGLQNRFLWTPHNQPVKICMCGSVLGGLMQQQKFENTQSVPLSEFPYRLYAMAYKPGDPIW